MKGFPNKNHDHSKKLVLIGVMPVGFTVLLSVASPVGIAESSAVTAAASAHKANARSSLTLKRSPADADGFPIETDFNGMV